jgi:hypothetical protein
VVVRIKVRRVSHWLSDRARGGHFNLAVRQRLDGTIPRDCRRRTNAQIELATFRDDTALVIRFISRDAASYETSERVLDEAVGALRRQVELMDGLYRASANTMLVPDTNALYWNTGLDTWRLPWATSVFVVVLLPSVLKELDLHKMDERRSSRREKAERFARQVGEYRRRGPLLQGALWRPSAP